MEDWYGGSGWDWAGHSRAGAGQLHQTESIPRKPVGVLSCGGCGIHSGSNAPPPTGARLLLSSSPFPPRGEVVPKGIPLGAKLRWSGGWGDTGKMLPTLSMQPPSEFALPWVAAAS